MGGELFATSQVDAGASLSKAELGQFKEEGFRLVAKLKAAAPNTLKFFEPRLASPGSSDGVGRCAPGKPCMCGLSCTNRRICAYQTRHNLPMPRCC